MAGSACIKATLALMLRQSGCGPVVPFPPFAVEAPGTSGCWPLAFMPTVAGGLPPASVGVGVSVGAVGVTVGSGTPGVPVGVSVGNGVTVGRIGVPAGVVVTVTVGVAVTVVVGVGVTVGSVTVAVTVGVGDGVDAGVGVGVRVAVGCGGGVAVGFGDGVEVAFTVGVTRGKPDGPEVVVERGGTEPFPLLRAVAVLPGVGEHGLAVAGTVAVVPAGSARAVAVREAASRTVC